jgi:hypothetical protein
VDSREAAERFARTWEVGWLRGDAAAISALYAEDCSHRSMPFRPLHEGRDGVVDYVRWALSTERATEVRFSRPLLAGDVATVEYVAHLVEEPDRKPVTIAGCALVRFGPDGLVAEARDYWHQSDGRRPPTGETFLAGR